MDENKEYLKFVELMQNEDFKEKVIKTKTFEEFKELEKEYDLDIAEEEVIRYFESSGVKSLNEDNINQLINGGKEYHVRMEIYRKYSTYICPICDVSEAYLRNTETKKDNCGDEYFLYQCQLKPKEHRFRRYREKNKWTSD